MVQTLRRVFLTLLFLSVSTSNTFSMSGEETQEQDSPIDIMGTVSDHNSFELPFYHIPLPRLFLMKDAEGNISFEGFWSTEGAVESGLFMEEHHVLEPTQGAHIVIDFSITSHLVYFWIGMVLAVWLTMNMARRYKKGVGRNVEPKGAFQNVFEVLFVFIRDDIARDNIDDHKSDRYVPYLFTVFMGITFMNLFGLFPWAATATADITVTAVLAVITFFITQFSGTKDYWGHVFWFPGVPVLVKLIMIPVEVVGLFTKPFALAIRLFANMMSGKIMIIAILGLVFIFAEMYGSFTGYTIGALFSVPMTAILYFLKAFVALLQAYIFTLLSAVFIGMAAEDHHAGEEGYYVEHID
jgi:F-type H+-transporting ATPase subunit a